MRRVPSFARLLPSMNIKKIEERGMQGVKACPIERIRV